MHTNRQTGCSAEEKSDRCSCEDGGRGEWSSAAVQSNVTQKEEPKTIGKPCLRCRGWLDGIPLKMGKDIWADNFLFEVDIAIILPTLHAETTELSVARNLSS